nr:PREDICTED: TATA box-binding protein-associated factor RNA polymerase I subunit B isoform X1 [Megachile rotundata]
MYTCKVCKSTDFYKEAGYFFCQTCQTQNENIREEVFELRVDNTTRLRRTRIRQLKSDASGEELGWTSWEVYNFVLIGLTNELIELGVTPDIKMTILQLWATYLGKLEVAFISTKHKSIPKLARRYNRRDAAIIYGKVKTQKRSKRRRRSGSSTNTSISGFQSEGSSAKELSRNKKLLVAADYDRYLQSQASSEMDDTNTVSQSMYSDQTGSIKSSDNGARVRFSSHAQKEAKKIKRLSKNIPKYKRSKYKASHISTQYKVGPHIITPMKLWAIIYLALRVHHQPIQLGDMLRYGREGHLSYYKLDHLLPPEVNSTKIEKHFLSQTVEITHKGMRRIIATMAKFLDVWNLTCPDFLPLVNRYCQELALPRGIQLYTERLIALAPPKMIFNSKKSYIPNYEGRAIAFIIVVLKTLFALDGITEYQISRIAEKINSAAFNQNSFNDKLFSFNEWQRYIECRKTILAHAHFPTKMKYSLESVGINDSYVKFLEHISSKTDKKEPDAKNSKHFLPDDLISAMTKHITNLSINDLSPKTIEIFPPSLTPLHSYFQQLLDHPYYDIPNIARSDFFLAKVGYTTKPNLLIELADQYNIRLEVVDSNLHFLEKYVPPFEQPKMPSIKELQQLVDIQDDSKSKRVNEYENLNANESLNDYLHAKLPCKMKFDVAKHQYYDKSKSTMKHFNDIDVKNDFIFMETLPNGKLAIPTNNDSEDKNEEENTSRQENMLLKTAFCDKYNLQLSLAEKESVNNLDTTTMAHFRKQKSKMARNTKGQFIKDSIEKVNKSGEHVGLGNSAQLNTTDERHSNFDDIDAITKVETVFSNVPDSYDANDISTSYGNTDVSTLVTSKENNTNVERFFRPFKEYWMYHCIFSRVKPKNFAVFERALPRTFRWLLNECALTVEMSTEDLYEEVCLIEAYHTHVLKSCNSENVQYSEPISKNQLNLILSKW